MKTILFLGDHKNLFGKLALWLKDDFIVYHKATNADTTEVEPDLIFCIYCQENRDGYWKGISYAKNPPVVIFGSWTDHMLDSFYMNHHYFTSPAWQRSYHVPQGLFTLLPVPIDITEIPDARLDASRSFRVTQSFMPMSHNKSARLIKEICAENAIPLEQIIGLPKAEAFQKISSESCLVVDQFWAGEIGMVSWEALAMGIPAILWVSQDTVEEFTKVFGSFPPLINLEINGELTKTMTYKERDAILRPALTQKLLDIKNGLLDLVSIGQQGRQWMIENYNQTKITDIYANFFNQILGA